jgi:(E)-4-hydroxy-3-methylbut-2-enyl-diphosphate synthase
MYNRLNTRPFMVRDIQIGGQNKVVIQSMCNTKTKDVEATVKQIKELENVGCEIIRVACLDIEDAKAIKEIKKHIHIPIVADIHFDYKIALEAVASGVDKIRINPGNIGDEEKTRAVVEACKVNKIPIRIGVNGGSLEKELLDKYGSPCAEAMIESARRHVEILEKLDFYDIGISLKASNLEMCIKAYELAAEEFKYPLHLGITEAGTAFSGTVKSSIGLGVLLRQGIGDTLRVSLTANPIDEIKAGKELLRALDLDRNGSIEIVSCPTCGRTKIDLIGLSQLFKSKIENINTNGKKIKVALMGCAVNGPGEAREADVGIAGGNGDALLFRRGEIIGKIAENDVIGVLIDEINKIGNV